MKTQAAVESFLNNRRALNRSANTLEWYASNLTRFAIECPKLPMKPEPIEEFLARVVPDQKQDQLRHAYYRSIRALYRFICRRKRFPNPIDLIDPPTVRKKVKQTLNARQMFGLISLSDNLRDQALLSIFIDTGARASEIATLTKVNVFEDTIKVDGKTNQREIPISDTTRRLLLMLIATDGKSEYVFTNHRGHPLTRSGIYWIVHGYMQRAGVQGPKLGSHRLRHSFGRGFLVNGGNIRALQKIMGHASIKTTEGYTELAIEELVDMHHKYTPLRSVQAAAQQSLFDTVPALKQAEEILERSKG